VAGYRELPRGALRMAAAALSVESLASQQRRCSVAAGARSTAEAAAGQVLSGVHCATAASLQSRFDVAASIVRATSFEWTRWTGQPAAVALTVAGQGERLEVGPEFGWLQQRGTTGDAEGSLP